MRFRIARVDAQGLIAGVDAIVPALHGEMRNGEEERRQVALAAEVSAQGEVLRVTEYRLVVPAGEPQRVREVEEVVLVGRILARLQLAEPQIAIVGRLLPA